MGNFLIRYDNCVNSMFPEGLTKLEMNAFMFILSSFNGASSDEISIEYRKIRDIIKYNPKRTTKEFDEVLEKLCAKLRPITLTVGNDEEDGDYYLFPTFIRNWYDQMLTIGINPHAKKLIDIPKGYTQFDIREFISLKLKASKYIFMNLKQFRTTGVWHVGMNEFKRRLGVSSYNNNNCIQKLITPAINELNERGIFDNLTFKTELERSQGSPVRALLFTFTPESGKKSDHENTASPDPETKNGENGDFGSKKQENVPASPKKSESDDPGIVIDSMYCTAEALLKGMISENNIDFIAREAKKCNLTPFMLKCCINNALGRDNIGNIVGYIITLIRKSLDRKSAYTTGSYGREPVQNPCKSSFHNFHERNYDFEALEKEAFSRA